MTKKELEETLRHTIEVLHGEIREKQVLELVYQNAQIGICITDENGSFIEVNPNYCDLYGYKREELLGKPFTIHFQHYSKKAQRAILQEYKSFIQDGSHQEGEYEVSCKNGERKIVNAVRGKKAGEKYVVTCVLDLTKRKQAEEAQQRLIEDLSEKAKKIQALEDMILICAWSGKVERNGRWIEMEKFLAETFGVTISHGISPEAREKFFGDRPKKKRSVEVWVECASW